MILVTGATGFFGRHVIAELAERGRKVRALSRGPASELADAGVDVREGDVTGELPAGLWDGIEAVVHLAGFVSRSPDDGQRMMRVHIGGTRRLFESAADAGVKRVVLASTSGTIAVSRTPEPI